MPLGVRGVEGMVEAIRAARETGLPFFGICLGMQTAIIEFARNVCGIADRDIDRFTAAVVEVMAGPHRLVSLMTAEAVDDLRLRVGDEAVCVVKATNVMVEIPSAREPRG